MLRKAKTARLVITLYRHITDKLPTSYRHITNCRPTVGRLSADCRPTDSLCFGENLSAVCRPTDGRQSANRRPTVGRQTADSRPTDGRQSANRRPTVGQQTADSRPTGFFGSSSSQLPDCFCINCKIMICDLWPVSCVLNFYLNSKLI